MRRILIESARKKLSIKGGAKAPHSHHIDHIKSDDNDFDANVLDLDRALTSLEDKDQHMACVVKLRYFSGLTIEETALALEVSPRSINRLWVSARAWLIVHMDSAL